MKDGLEFRFHSLSMLENFKLLRQKALELQQSRTVPAIVRRNLSDGRYATPPPAPTEASEIFTPGPMVEEMEIFFM